MAKQVSVTLGFITNSSSVVHHFPRELFEDARVQAFMEAFAAQDGFVGDNMWHRGRCTTVAMTRDQKAIVAHQMRHNEYDAKGPEIDVESDDVVVVYGDEYTTVASQLCSLVCEVAKERDFGKGSGLEEKLRFGGVSYN